MTEQTTTVAGGNTLKSLILPAIRNFVIGVLVLGVVLCLLAGTFSYWRGWVFTILFAVLTTTQGIYLGIKDPELLERRKNIAPEGESKAQKIFIVVALLADLCLVVFSAIDRRFGWSQMPVAVSVLGDALLVVSFYLYYLVFRENSYAASSIKTFEGQKVISTGPYARVRHPKYVGDLFLVIGVPLALGSWWALALIVLSIAGLVWRILDEEKLLRKDLPGYTDYMQKVRYRLVPYLW
ncbi:MAG TPA: isoprenylcysteine carboxylmethyltransferase family protein [Aggregatilineales bacterium]|nr:isoprenylcysteine carboxylmethyltransferase family protein [Aggregatilineales bacterium]